MRRTNHLAVLITVILHQILGYLWYGVLFFKPWVDGLGKRPDEINQKDPYPFIVDIVGWFIAAYLIAWLIKRTNSNSGFKGARLGFVLWLGVALPAIWPHYAFAGVRASVIWIDLMNLLVALVMTGGILGNWRKR
jgi:hypothetical protein